MNAVKSEFPPDFGFDFNLPSSSMLDLSTMDESKLKDIHDFLISLAYKAGEIITNALPDTSGTGSKKNSSSSFHLQQKQTNADVSQVLT